jgi:regulator of PEP synthase PpsR (kinase-PPPase family)
MGPLLARLSESLQVSPSAEPGLAQPFDQENVQRIEALNFTVKHDDGQSIGDLDKAEIVLLGVSRTAKTPVSIFLAYRGWRVANVPLALGVNPPAALFDLPPRRVVGLVATPERLSTLRRSRVSRLTPLSAGYASIDHIRSELAFAYEVFDRRRDWRVVDVTDKSIEEAAAEVVSLVGAPDGH